VLKSRKLKRNRRKKQKKEKRKKKKKKREDAGDWAGRGHWGEKKKIYSG